MLKCLSYYGFLCDIKEAIPATLHKDGKFTSRAQPGRFSVNTPQLYYDDIKGVKGSLGETIISLLAVVQGLLKG